MPRSASQMQIMPFPYGSEIFDSRLKSIHEEPGAAGTDIVFVLDSFQPQSVPEVCHLDGRPHERLRGVYVPMQLRFVNASWVHRTGIYQVFDSLPEDHTARQLYSVQRSRLPDINDLYWFATGAGDPGDLSLRATGSQLEPQAGPARPVEIVRRWSPVPPLSPGRLPHRPVLYRRYGGDPISFRLGRRVYARRLFIGGLYHQQEERPLVHHVLNLCGVENPWCARSGESPEDRRIQRGEMSAGMDAMDIFEEAAWVAERLRAGRRVLVHCFAGINRSSTVCCATLMFLEGVSPDAALARIRQRHPQAWPDPYHWFTLRWMSQALNTSDVPASPPALPEDVHQDPEPQEAPLLLEETPIG